MTVDLDTPPDPFDLLEGARAARSEPERSEAAVLAALQVAPNDRDVRMGAYKFYFYANRLAEAAPHAAWCVRDGARALGLPEDWRRLTPGSVDCTGYPKPQRFLVQSLVAWGWCKARTGEIDDGLAALAKAAEIDPSDGFGAARIAAIVAGRAPEEED
ncbi:MAG: hypothetical protein GX458_07790 [Phyllobacteriaceae bacterium]|nr:hypothetical protein [Phyllobacteriaceae bacterium]